MHRGLELVNALSSCTTVGATNVIVRALGGAAITYAATSREALRFPKKVGLVVEG